MKKLFYFLLCLPLLLAFFSLTSRNGGAAFVLMQDRTGSPFTTGTCGSVGCHSGGAFNPTISLAITDGGGNSTTAYTGGTTYTLTYTCTAASPGSIFFGMQSVALTSLNTPAGNLSNPSLNGQVTILSGRRYFEQRSASSSGIFTVDWMAPPTGTGPITFYFIGNAVNGLGSEAGDQATSGQSLVLPEACSVVTNSLTRRICQGQTFQIGTNVYDTTGVYQDTLIAANTCDSIVTLTLTVTPLPTPNLTVPVGPYCNDVTSVTLMGSPTGGTFSGTAVTGSTFNPSTAGVGNHTIFYSVTDTNTCTGMDSVSVEVIICNSINRRIGDQIFIYPISTENEIHITGLNSNSTVEVFDIAGKSYLKTLIKGNALMETISNPPAMLFVRISNSNESKVFRVPFLSNKN